MADQVEKGLRRFGITVSKPVLAALCIIFGILLIVFPDLAGILIGIFLLIQGILLLTDYMEVRHQQPYQTYTPPPAPPQTPPAAPSKENP